MIARYTLALFLIATVCRAEESAEVPQCYLQILNGLNPNPVTYSINGKTVFPNATAGQRITSIGIATLKGEIVAAEKDSQKQLKIPFEFKKDSHNTLIIAGDFQRLDPQGVDPKFRIVYRLFENKFQTGSKSVSAHIVNGMYETELSVEPNGGRPQTIASLSVVDLDNLPADLILKVEAGERKRVLYLGQSGVIRNLAIVFFKAENGFGFKAMTEITPAASEAENKAASPGEADTGGAH